MLSDKRLENLLRDAHAIETFERDGGTHLKAKPVVVRRKTVRWAFYAAAAVLLFAGLQIAINAFSAPPKQTSHAAKPADAHTPLPPKSSLLLAVYQNDAGKLSCVNWSAEALNGRTISSFSTDELTRMGLALACDPSAARILVVGLEGPAAALPTSDARAQAVAQCLSSTTPCGSGTFNSQTCASAGCLDHEVTVRVESVALR